MNSMSSTNQVSRKRFVAMVVASPLGRVDPRAKLLLATVIACCVMLPLEKLSVFWLLFMVFISMVGLAGAVLLRIRRIAFIIVILFFIDWFVVDVQFAVLITLRLTLLVSSFVIFFSTTRPEEFRLALESLRLPYRYAFSLSLSLFSVTAIYEEWRAIREAQRSRGAWEEGKGLRKIGRMVGGVVALVVPAVVLTVKRAWLLTESAHTRGFDSPRRCSCRRLIMKPIDWTVLLVTLSITVLFFI
jgi:energy-coupling factor transport system permease protein